MIDYKKLIEDATHKIAKYYSTNGGTLAEKDVDTDEFQHCLYGASLPNELLLKAIETLENYSHELSTYEGVKPNLAMKTLVEIKQALEEAAK